MMMPPKTPPVHDRLYLVWSLEHRAWWRRHGRGYTPVLDEAGRFTRDEAATICEHANIVAIEELMTPIPLSRTPAAEE